MDNKNVGGGLFILGQSREELAEYHITGPGRFLTGNPDGLIIVGWLCIILFGAFLLFLLLNYKNCAKRPWFVLNSDGFYSYSTNSGFKGMIGWNEIMNFHMDLQNFCHFPKLPVEAFNGIGCYISRLTASGYLK